MPKEQRPRELTYIRAFAGKDGPAALLELLSQGSLRLIYELRDEPHGAIKKLAERVPSRPDEVSGKYVEVLDESIGALQQGGVTTFDERLEELIGPPHSRVLETMLQAHCEAPDASTPFVASTYMLTTTSKIEWWFVVDPVDGLVKHVDPRAELGDTHVPRLSSTGWPAEAGVLAPERARVPRTLQALLQEMRLLKIGAQLKAAGSEPLVDAEVIAARLYTGPLYVKYTAVLKALSKGAGKLTSSVAAGGSGSGYSSDEYARQRAEKARQQDEEQMRYFEALCLGNTYATTIHALNSALIKLGKLGGAERVYRGVSSAVLPDWLWELSGGGNGKPIISSSLSGGGDEDGGGGDGVLTPALGGNGQLSKPRGGIEFGFLSATSDAELAMRYAADTPGSGGHAHRIVLELHTSMLTRAAGLAVAVSSRARVRLPAADRPRADRHPHRRFVLCGRAEAELKDAHGDSTSAHHQAETVAPATHRALPGGHAGVRGTRKSSWAATRVGQHAQKVRADLLQQPREVCQLHRGGRRRPARRHLASRASFNLG